MGRSLDGATVLVTGASSGIGRAAARAFVAGGAHVVGVARSAERLASLREECGDGCTVEVADVTDLAAMDAMAARVVADRGIPDVVVANAGIGYDARFQATSDEALHRVFDVNVYGAWRTVRPFVDGMVARGSGRILFVSSVVGKRGIPNYAAYSGSKFAVQGAAAALRTELWGTGVSVGTVCPSSTESEFQNRAGSAGLRQERVRVARHSAESVADAIVAMARSNRREIVLSAEGKLMAWVEKWAPGLLDRVLARVLVRGPRDD